MEAPGDKVRALATSVAIKHAEEAPRVFGIDDVSILAIRTALQKEILKTNKNTSNDKDNKATKNKMTMTCDHHDCST